MKCIYLLFQSLYILFFGTLISDIPYIPSSSSSSTLVSVEFTTSEHIHTPLPDYDTILSFLSENLDNACINCSDIRAVGNYDFLVSHYNVENLEEKDKLQSVLDNIECPQIVFRDYDGNEILNNSHISQCHLVYDYLTSSSFKEYYILLEFTAKGEKLFYDATASAAARPAGENCIFILFDDEIISNPYVYQPISDSSCVISGQFTFDEANKLANLFFYALHNPSYTIIK